MVGVYLFLLILLLPLALVAMIVYAIVNSKKGEAYEKFNSGVKIIFAYIFVIASLFAMVIGVISGTRSLLDYTMPDTIKSVANTTSVAESVKVYGEKNSEMTVGLQIQNDKNTAMVNFVSSITTALVAIPIFIYYGKIVKRERQKSKR